MRPCAVREPDVSSTSSSEEVVRVGWGKEGSVGLFRGEGIDWRSSVVVYGIVGILQLTFGAFHLPSLFSPPN